MAAYCAHWGQGLDLVIRVNAQYDVEYRPGVTVQDVLDVLKFSFRMIVV